MGAALGFVLVAACSSGDYGSSLAPTAAAPVSTNPGAVVRAGAIAAAPAPAPVPTFGAPASAKAAVVPGYGASAYGAAPYGAPITGADGYPNINVDTARRLSGTVRSAAEQDKLEADLLALGARQRSHNEAAPGSAIQELQDLGRRSKAEAERQIESGAVPATP